MTSNKKELAVAALRNGTVIDHIPSVALFDAVRILGIEGMDKAVTIGYNLDSEQLGSKGIIKIADVEFDQDTLNRIAIIAPTAMVNIIRDYEVASKKPVTLPETIVGVVRCGNPKCITNNEPMNTRFKLVDPVDIKLKCLYCNHTFTGTEVDFV